MEAVKRLVLGSQRNGYLWRKLISMHAWTQKFVHTSLTQYFGNHISKISTYVYINSWRQHWITRQLVVCYSHRTECANQDMPYKAVLNLSMGVHTRGPWGWSPPPSDFQAPLYTGMAKIVELWPNSSCHQCVHVHFSMQQLPLSKSSSRNSTMLKTSHYFVTITRRDKQG